jgi:hypothetical protein
MQKEYVVCRFFMKERHDRPGQKQLQCYLGNSETGTLYVVDHKMTLIREDTIKEGVPYYCGISRILAQSDRVAVVTVVVLEEIEFSKGAFGINQMRSQWQCNLTSSNSVLYMFIIDKNCKKTPSATGEFWTFKLNKVISVMEGSVIMSVLLDEPTISERAKRRREKKGGQEAA